MRQANRVCRHKARMDKTRVKSGASSLTRRYAAFLFVLSIALFLVNRAEAQQSSADQKPPATGMGVATGGAHAAVKDSHARPITAGGFVDGAPVVFADITKMAGLEKFIQRSGDAREKNNSGNSRIGSGVARLRQRRLAGYLSVEWLDDGRAERQSSGSSRDAFSQQSRRYFHGRHRQSGRGKCALGFWRCGRRTTTTMVGQILYVANFGKNRLYHNNHDGTFTDVAEKAGVTLGGWSTGPTWGDYDHDGLLDLFVPGYVKFDSEHPIIAGKGKMPPNFCQFRGINMMCGPLDCKGSAIIFSTTTETERSRM